jgi:hypothetical protein
MRTRLVLGLVLGLSLVSCAGARDTVRLARGGEPLRLSRVVLYENGMAHFERRGRAEGDAVDLVVPEAQVDDVLRSLTVVDGDTAAITGVRMLPAGEHEDVTLRVGLGETGARDLRITYVAEVPGWRPTYRLVVSDGGRVHVQGLAVIDNPTGEDWQDIALTLSTEVPLSFRFDLREQRVAYRPRFGADGHLVRDDLDEGSPNGTILAMPSPRGPSDVNFAYGLAQRDQPEMSTRAGVRIGAPAGEEDDDETTDTVPGASSALLAFEERPEESGGVFGSVEGFDLARGESGLVPFVDTTTEGSLAVVYKPSPGGALSQEHPYRAVLFQSPSDAALLTGPVAIYAGERFVGDGVTGAIPAHAHAFVPYALERSVRVDHTTEDAEDEVRATHLTGGMLTVEVRAVHRERFVMTATGTVDAPAYAFAAALEGYTPRELPTGTIVTGQGYFLPLALAEGHGEVSLDLLRRSTSTVNIASTPGHPYVPALLSLLQPGDEVARLREIADRLVSVHHELSTIEQDLAVERAALDERRSALESLHGITTGGAIRARLATSVETGVAHVDALASRSAVLRGEEITLREEWYALLRALIVRSA